jgi:hypothetical protein
LARQTMQHAGKRPGQFTGTGKELVHWRIAA